MAWPVDWDRASVLGAIEEVSREPMHFDAALPDTLIAKAQELGLLPVHLKTWIYDSPEHPFTCADLEKWAKRWHLSGEDAAALVHAAPPAIPARVTACSLYGHSLFVGAEGPVLVALPGAESNRCPLVTTAFSPCRMEVEGKLPDWTNCPRNPDNYEAYRREKSTSFPREATDAIH